MNEIVIQELEVTSHVGVPEEERAEAQRLLVNIVMTPCNGFADLKDDITRTVDYHRVSQRVISLAAERPRQLIETLATETVDMLLKEFAVERAEVEVRKFILPETRHVAVRYGRGRTE